MTHYTIDYKGLTPQQQHDKAIADIIDYMGQDRYDRIVAAVRQEERWQPSLEKWRLMISFGGVQGYPARAMYNEIWPYG